MLANAQINVLVRCAHEITQRYPPRGIRSLPALSGIWRVPGRRGCLGRLRAGEKCGLFEHPVGLSFVVCHNSIFKTG